MTTASGRLAQLAAQLVLQEGLASTRALFSDATQRAEQSLVRIDGLAARAAPERPASVAARSWPRATEHEALVLARQTWSAISGPAVVEGTTGRLEAGPPTADADPVAQAAELLILLRLAPGNRETPPAPLDDAPAALLGMVLPPAIYRYLPAVDPITRQPVRPSVQRSPLVVVLYACAIVAYLLLRYGGNYVEQDTAETTQLVEAVANFQSALPDASVHPVYPSGFGFEAVNLYLMRLTGLSVQALETRVWPFLLLGIALLAFLAFREMTGDDRAAALGSLFLFMQPDFLFTSLRGSHEKMTYCLLLAAFLLLFRSYRYRSDLWQFVAYVALFYLMIFAIVCTNSTFGSSLIVALTLSFLGGALCARLLGGKVARDRRALVRLGYVSLSSFLLLFAELFYFYQPSEGIFHQFQSAMDRVAGFALSFAASDNPYAYVALGWRSPVIYVVLTLFTWTTIAISGVAWCQLAWRFMHGGWVTAPDQVRLRWLLYAGLALQVGVGIAVDFSGVLGANLQLRLFPVYLFVAIPTCSEAVVRLTVRLEHRPALRRLALAAGGLTAASFTAFSALKATNEPLLSNKWTFYGPTEAQAMDWLAVNEPQGAVWTDIDERLREVDLFRSPPTEDAASRFPTQFLPTQAPNVMLSRITLDRMARTGTPRPDISAMNELYDNGLVRIYRQLPRTPLQR